MHDNSIRNFQALQMLPKGLHANYPSAKIQAVA